MKAFSERLMALAFVAFCLFYGLSATTIAVFPGREHELITSRSFPYGLTIVGLLCALYIAVKAGADAEAEEAGQPVRRQLDWLRFAALIAVSVAYSFLLERTGFIVSTTLFLAAGMLVMGERRWVPLIAAAVAPPLIFWALLEFALDIHLPSFSWPGA